MDGRLVTALIVVFGVPAVLVSYIALTERALGLFPQRARPVVRPWLWLAPALAFLGLFLVYPTIGTFLWSLRDARGVEFVGLDNYLWFFTNESTLAALRNNVIWLVGLTGLAVGLGLAIAVLVDRVRYETVAKTVIFVPLAISSVAASVIWRFMYEYQPPGVTQIGTLNAAAGAIGLGPIPWLQVTDFSINTLLLVTVMVWMWTGFCMVIISAALKGINPELLEAARVDGANEWQVFRRIVLPLLAPTLAVVSTTMIITALKAFDIVHVMTNGLFDTEVIANRMVKEMFQFGHFGRAGAIAMILLAAIIPIMLVNIRRFRAQEAIR
jgi:alpha-glucoside transport system permease protein